VDGNALMPDVTSSISRCSGEERRSRALSRESDGSCLRRRIGILRSRNASIDLHVSLIRASIETIESNRDASVHRAIGPYVFDQGA